MDAAIRPECRCRPRDDDQRAVRRELPVRISGRALHDARRRYPRPDAQQPDPPVSSCWQSLEKHTDLTMCLCSNLYSSSPVIAHNARVALAVAAAPRRSGSRPTRTPCASRTCRSSHPSRRCGLGWPSETRYRRDGRSGRIAARRDRSVIFKKKKTWPSLFFVRSAFARDRRRTAAETRPRVRLAWIRATDRAVGPHLDEEIRNTPSSVTLEYSRWLMGREWPWHTSGALAGACMAIAQQAPEVCGCKIRRKPLGCPHDRDRKGWRRRRAGRLRAGVCALSRGG